MKSAESGDAGQTGQSRPSEERPSRGFAKKTWQQEDMERQESSLEKIGETETPESVLADDRLFEQLEELLQRPEFVERLKHCRSEPEAVQEDTAKDDDSDDSYVIVTKEDAIEGLVHTIATCVMSCPEAQDVNPVELQAAIVKACKEMKKSKVKSAWGWCSFIYRTASWTYTAFNLYANPWIIRAILLAFWSMPKFFGRLFV